MSGLETVFAAFQIAHINYVSFRSNQSAAALLDSHSVAYSHARMGAPDANSNAAVS